MEDGNASPSRKKYVWLSLLLLVLIAILCVLIYLLQRRASYKSTTSTYIESTPAPVSNSDQVNSYAFASPVKAKTGGEPIRVTIYVLDARGMGLAGQTIEVGQAPGLKVVSSQEVTDSTGMAFFDFTAVTPSTYVVATSIAGELLRSVSITFEK